MEFEVKIKDKEEQFEFSIIKNDNLYSLVDTENVPLLEMELDFENKSFRTISNRENIDENELQKIYESLFVRILEMEQSGADSFGEKQQLEQNPYDPEKIKVRTDKLSITLLSQMIDSGDIDLNPDFQRNFVWDSFQKSRLIESILLRIPLPMFYFAEDFEGKLSIVDGLQRISTIKEFMDNKFPLKNLQYLKDSCEGRYFKDEKNKKGLDVKYTRWFNLTTISANIIDPTSPYKVKYDIFRRINTGGKPLNNQEIRNCLTGQGLRDVLKTMVSLGEFKSATDNSIRSTRMEDQEIVLRYLAFYDIFEEKGNIDTYSGYMENFLDDFTERHNKTPKDNFIKQIEAFKNAMKNAEYLIGKKYAFRKILPKNISEKANKQLINKALFVCTSLLLSRYSHNSVKEMNEQEILTELIAKAIESDEELYRYLSYGTNGKNNLTYTFDTLKELFSKNIKV
ncbi:DUF262 domain-containing protein [Capnocytophaga cynodegmi]|uniref:DUF262 domain-containing protein n=1 Tax=Capnocytophaga cynodegmi TaxID=28189 RepID=UPI001BB347F6|nr:DUF262 domain-containing protein [Capnocytophaga cynodegmi]